MKLLFTVLLFAVSTPLLASQTPQSILKAQGFVLVTKQNGKEIYYRPKEVHRVDGIAYYSNTVFYTKAVDGQTKYSLRSEYKALGCKERLVLVTGIHNVPFIGKSSFVSKVNKGLKDSDFKPLGKLDSIMYPKVCKRG